MKAEMDVGTNRKAFEINLDRQKYGTFAEIGAARKWRGVFSRRRAAGTIAKTDIGLRHDFQRRDLRACRPFCESGALEHDARPRVRSFLERWIASLELRRTFFVFADTVAARSFKQHNESQDG